MTPPRAARLGPRRSSLRADTHTRVSTDKFRRKETVTLSDLTSGGPWEAAQSKGDPGARRWAEGAPAAGGDRQAPREQSSRGRSDMSRPADPDSRWAGGPGGTASRVTAPPQARKPGGSSLTSHSSGGGGPGPLCPVPRPKLNGPLRGPRQLRVGASPGAQDAGPRQLRMGASLGAQDAGRRGTCYSGGSPRHTRAAARDVSPHTEAHPWRFISSRGLSLVAWDNPTAPTQQADHAGRESTTSLPSRKARNLAHAPHTPASDAGRVSVWKAVYSPRPQCNPLPVLVHIYSSLENFQLPISMIIQFPNY